MAKETRGRKPLDKNGSTQITMRLPDSWLAEVDAILKKIPDDGSFPTRIGILRMMVRSGLDTAKAASRR